MENLLLLFDRIAQISPLGVFNQEVLLVQNPGMQHWLNLSIAKQRGISMNIDYALPAQYLWKLIRALASDDDVPEQSPYSREVLCWRIDALLASEKLVKDQDFASVSQYWQGNAGESSNHFENQQAQLKRYQLAVQLADLYEQYLIFRPDWLDAWQQGSLNGAFNDFSNEHGDVRWQAKLWEMLTQEIPYNPVALVEDAIKNLANKKSLLPRRLSFFGLNTMAPMWLSFITHVSEHIDVHFFHLNPCFSYWGDIMSEKLAFKQIQAWAGDVAQVESFVGNPLLANFGQQGREFVSLLQEYSTFNIEAFDQQDETAVQISQQPVLAQVQHDILTLTDKREQGTSKLDDSITITSCHSALREVQGLHDFLLHQFNQDSELTPKDVLVMCPKIEDYAPYVHAVFSRGWQDLDNNIPPLPCSIADRNAIDSDPLVASFVDLLNLPDSRFQVSQLVALLRLPAIASRFSVPLESIDKISHWLAKSAIHWGIDSAHKETFIGLAANDNFTWHQGLTRLLRGFAFADCQSIYQEQLVLDLIEGDDALLLGQLLLFIEQLQQFTINLSRERTAVNWHSYLMQQLDLLMDDKVNAESEASFVCIVQAINALVEYCQHAGYEQEIELSIVIDFLTQHFSQGDASRQFMVGQVTFCSMLPMRSIPFKVIAVLGLNDGEFPRQRQPLTFDLMANTQSRLGDRSRRGDDRYLFLEAIISARKALYLSYQGRNIRNNSVKQPSLVLKEFMDYLTAGYGWSFEVEQQDITELRELPMQAYSQQNYAGKYASFDAKWFNLGQSKDNATINKPLGLKIADGYPEHIKLTIDELITFFIHPSKYFAQKQLQLNFKEQTQILNDDEPFAIDQLQSYLVRQALLQANLDDNTFASSSMVLKEACLSGLFPDQPNTHEVFQHWQDDALDFANDIIVDSGGSATSIECQLTLDVKLDANHSVKIDLSHQFWVKDNNLLRYRSSSAKVKDILTLYVEQVFLCVWQEKMKLTELSSHQLPLMDITQSKGFYFNTKAQQVEHFTIDSSTIDGQHFNKLLRTFLAGQQQPLLLNAGIAHVALQKKRGKIEPMTQDKFSVFWHGNHNTPGFNQDAYIDYFWPELVCYRQIEDELMALYQPVYNAVVKASATKKKSSQE